MAQLNINSLLGNDKITDLINSSASISGFKDLGLISNCNLMYEEAGASTKLLDQKTPGVYVFSWVDDVTIPNVTHNSTLIVTKMQSTSQTKYLQILFDNDFSTYYADNYESTISVMGYRFIDDESTSVDWISGMPITDIGQVSDIFENMGGNSFPGLYKYRTSSKKYDIGFCIKTKDSGIYTIDSYGIRWKPMGGSADSSIPVKYLTRKPFIVIGTTDSYDVFDVQVDYLCDGTNDGQQFNEAINELTKNGRDGGKIFIKSGTYNINTSSIITMTDTIPFIEFEGETRDTTIISINLDTKGPIPTSLPSMFDGGTFKNLTFTATSEALNAKENNAVLISGLEFINCNFKFDSMLGALIGTSYPNKALKFIGCQVNPITPGSSVNYDLIGDVMSGDTIIIDNCIFGNGSYSTQCALWHNTPNSINLHISNSQLYMKIPDPGSSADNQTYYFNITNSFFNLGFTILKGRITNSQVNGDLTIHDNMMVSSDTTYAINNFILGNILKYGDESSSPNPTFTYSIVTNNIGPNIKNILIES